jgi:hypothetical protein
LILTLASHQIPFCSLLLLFAMDSFLSFCCGGSLASLIHFFKKRRAYYDEIMIALFTKAFSGEARDIYRHAI